MPYPTQHVSSSGRTVVCISKSDMLDLFRFPYVVADIYGPGVIIGEGHDAITIEAHNPVPMADLVQKLQEMKVLKQ
jgi:hypothetical protein